MTRNGKFCPFPDHTQGFFYYHHDVTAVDQCPLASSVRFRCTPSQDPTTFSEGKDLIHPSGLPWQHSLQHIATMQDSYFRDQLLRTGMVTSDQVTRIRRIFERNVLSSFVIYRPDQLFSLKFHHISLSLHAVVGDKLLPFRVVGPFRDNRLSPTKGSIYGSPYHGTLPTHREVKSHLFFRCHAGSALVRFELSKLPRHSKSATIVLRIVKLIDPPECTIPDYDGYLSPPIEGELVRLGRSPWNRRTGPIVNVLKRLQSSS
jgi:hypothetical protein